MPNQPASAASKTSGIDDLRPRIESALQSAAEFGPGCPETLRNAIQYALLAPGKRLRPALVLMAAEACGGSLEEAMPGAVAVEMIHAYSLIHDDLPAMDDDDLRRGQPTVHVKYDEATAILAGDALQSEAFAQLSLHVADPHRAIEAVRVLSVAAGATRLVGGQADDLAAEKLQWRPPSAEPDAAADRTDGAARAEIDPLQHLESIHRRKTGALFAASLELGAILSGAAEESRQVLAAYAKHLGLAFQVVDDLLDYTADASELGKRTGKDADRGKLTYPGLLGAEGARRRSQELVEAAKQQVSVFGAAAWRLRWLADYVLERSH